MGTAGEVEERSKYLDKVQEDVRDKLLKVGLGKAVVTLGAVHRRALYLSRV